MLLKPVELKGLSLWRFIDKMLSELSKRFKRWAVGKACAVQAVERHPSLESFTADAAYQRQAEHVAREVLGVELHVTAKPKQPKPNRRRIKKGAVSNPSLSVGALNAPPLGLASANSSPKSTRKPLPAPPPGSGAP